LFAIQNRVNFVTFLETPILLGRKTQTKTGYRLELYLCLTEEEFGMLMLLLSVNVHMCGWEEEKGMFEV
jgi:hypothetical protein